VLGFTHVTAIIVNLNLSSGQTV